MEPVTREMLERSIEVLRELQPWADYSIGWAYGQPRIEARGGSVDISPYGTKRECNAFIWLMIKAIRMAEDHRNFSWATSSHERELTGWVR